MSFPISSVTAGLPTPELQMPDSITGSTKSSTSGPSPFQHVLSNAIQEVEGAKTSADQSVASFLSGEGQDLHSTILATQRADLEFQMFLQVRNKVVSAYQEIMKMQM
jgi:flagellar hook-basal body complex protein FliE